MKKSALLSLVAITVMSCAYLFFAHKAPSKNTPTTVGERLVAITQIAPHASLDRIHQGIVDVLAKHPELNAKIVFENAFGNIATATQIAQRFIGLNPAVIVPITTPSAQTVLSARKDSQVPIVFAAITDPVLASCINSDGTNIVQVTGVTDAPPYGAQAQQIFSFLRHKQMKQTHNTDVKNTDTDTAQVQKIDAQNKKDKPFVVGVLFNPSEANSQSQLKSIEAAVKKIGGQVMLSAANSTVNVSQATAHLVGKVDAIYIPNDNTIVSALSSVLQITHEHQIPVFASDPESVKAGCMGAIAPDQYEIGRQAGQIVVRILKGETAAAIPVQQAQSITEYRHANDAPASDVLLLDVANDHTIDLAWVNGTNRIRAQK